MCYTALWVSLSSSLERSDWLTSRLPEVACGSLYSPWVACRWEKIGGFLFIYLKVFIDFVIHYGILKVNDSYFHCCPSQSITNSLTLTLTHSPAALAVFGEILSLYHTIGELFKIKTLTLMTQDGLGWSQLRRFSLTLTHTHTHPLFL